MKINKNNSVVFYIKKLDSSNAWLVVNCKQISGRKTEEQKSTYTDTFYTK